MSLLCLGIILVFFTTYPFGISSESKNFPRCNESNVSGKIIIGNDVWIGYGAKILYGSIIGDGCIIAAGSIVRGKFKSYSMIAGNPAQKMYTRFDIKTIDILKKLQWWNLPQDVLKANISSIVSNNYEKLLKLYNEVNILQ